MTVAAAKPIQNGPTPRRREERNTSAVTLIARNTTVNASRYLVEIRKLRPNAEMMPAYGGYWLDFSVAQYARPAVPEPHPARNRVPVLV